MTSLRLALTHLQRQTAGLAALMLAFGCEGAPASHEAPRDAVFEVRSAVVGILFDPIGEGQGPELHQVGPVVRATSAPKFVLFGRAITDWDQDDAQLPD